MSLNHEYGKSIKNPVLLNSIPASIIFLNNLVTVEGLHILFHRYESNPSPKGMIDNYEIMVSDNRYDDIFISIHNDLSTWRPPAGYLFESSPEEMCKQLMHRQNLNILDEVDVISFDEKYFFYQKLPVKPEDLLAESRKLPPLETILPNSTGTNSRVRNFPSDLIKELPIMGFGQLFEDPEEIANTIKQRGKRPEYFLDSLTK